ncbi:MAG: hypothetical protein Q7K34_04405 [archaeon]|nr:hypothetical protein [archaeon]
MISVRKELKYSWVRYAFLKKLVNSGETIFLKKLPTHPKSDAFMETGKRTVDLKGAFQIAIWPRDKIISKNKGMEYAGLFLPITNFGA